MLYPSLGASIDGARLEDEGELDMPVVNITQGLQVTSLCREVVQ